MKTIVANDICVVCGEAVDHFDENRESERLMLDCRGFDLQFYIHRDCMDRALPHLDGEVGNAIPEVRRGLSDGASASYANARKKHARHPRVNAGRKPEAS
jgi:hypothetical protein